MASQEERDFMVAADMTLYSNPVNRALHMSKDPSKTSLKSMASDDDHKAGDAMIASDMTKYDSPLTKIEMEKIDRDKDTRNKETETRNRANAANNAAAAK